MLLQFCQQKRVFAEANPLVQEETGPSEANLFAGRYVIDPNQAPTKEVEPVAQLQSSNDPYSLDCYNESQTTVLTQ